MTKSFLVFLTGAAGAGLLLLRCVVALSLSLGVPEPAPDWQHAGLIILVVFLMAGFLSRYAAALCAALLFYVAVDADGIAAAANSGLHAATAIALALLGPGGYSIDSHLFGPRVIKLEE